MHGHDPPWEGRMAIHIRRREFIATLGGAAVAWPLAARAQQMGERVRLIGALTGVADEPSARARAAAFIQRLQELGWTDGRNMRLDYRWGGGASHILCPPGTEVISLSPGG